MDSSNGAQRRLNIRILNGQLYALIYPNNWYLVTNSATGHNLVDGLWHSLIFRCETGAKCITIIDGIKGEDAPQFSGSFPGVYYFRIGYDF